MPSYSTKNAKISSPDFRRCTYCGSRRGLVRDHVIPNSYIRDGRRYGGDWLVTACHECNTILGSNMLCTIPDRARFVASKLRIKYERYLRSPEWKCQDLLEIGYNLKTTIEASATIKDEIISRLRCLAHVAGMPDSYLTELICPPISEDKIPELSAKRLAVIKQRRAEYLRNRKRLRGY